MVLRWLSWAAGLQLSLLSSLGVRPAGFVPQAQVRPRGLPVAQPPPPRERARCPPPPPPWALQRCNSRSKRSVDELGRARRARPLLPRSRVPSPGVPPLPPRQLRELDGVLAHMHLREDQYRQVGQGRAPGWCV